MFDKYKIVVILTAYKRDYFIEQIHALLLQTTTADKIVILNNNGLWNHFNNDKLKTRSEFIQEQRPV